MPLTHWGRVRNTCINKQHGSDNGLPPFLVKPLPGTEFGHISLVKTSRKWGYQTLSKLSLMQGLFRVALLMFWCSEWNMGCQKDIYPVFTDIGNYLPISVNELPISVNELSISVNELPISVIHFPISVIHFPISVNGLGIMDIIGKWFTDIGKRITDIGKWFTDIGNSFADIGKSTLLPDIGKSFTDIGK